MKLKNIILTTIVLGSFSINAQDRFATKVYLNKLIFKGIEGSIEYSNAKGKMAHEIVLGYSQPNSGDNYGKYKNLSIDYRMNHYLFNENPLNGFYISAPIVNYQTLTRDNSIFNEKIEMVGLGAIIGYQFFLTDVDNGNLLLNIGAGSTFTFPINENVTFKNNGNYYDNFDSTSYNILTRLIRFNIGVGYTF